MLHADMILRFFVRSIGVTVNDSMKGLKRQKEAKTVKNRQGTEETRTRVKNQPKIKPDQPDTAGKTVKGRNKKERTISDKLSKFE
ncbi:hypothetical protein Tco_1394393, partial [Tanacetum coccineum]